MATEKITFSNADDCLSHWERANNGYGNISGEFSSGLSSFYLAQGYINEIEESISEMESFSKKEYDAFKAYIEEMKPKAEEPEIAEKEDTHGEEDADGVVSGGAGSTNGGKAVKKEGGTDHAKDVDVGRKPKKDIDKQKTEIPEWFDDSTLSQLNLLTVELVSMAKAKGISLEELLYNEKYYSEIKNILLASPNVSSETKKLIQGMTDAQFAAFFKDILKNRYYDMFKLNNLNVSIINNYLEKLAQEKGITVEELLTNSKYANELKGALSHLDEASKLYGGWEDLPAEDVQSNLLSLYTGDVESGVSTTGIEVSRSLVDCISEASEIPYDELLTDTAYAEALKEATMDLGKTAEFFDLLSNFSNDSIKGKINDVFMGGEV